MGPPKAGELSLTHPGLMAWSTSAFTAEEAGASSVDFSLFVQYIHTLIESKQDNDPACLLTGLQLNSLQHMCQFVRNANCSPKHCFHFHLSLPGQHICQKTALHQAKPLAKGVWYMLAYRLSIVWNT